MGKLVIYVILITVFEGALRKWLSVSLTIPLVLARDILALYGIGLAICRRSLALTGWGGQALMLWSVLLIMWALIQTLVNQISPLILVVGLRFWLLYLWFACAAATSVHEHDFRAIQKVLIYCLLVMAPLAVVQHFLPPGAFLNKQLDDDESRIFVVGGDIVRTTGTFSFTAGYSVFLAFISPWIFSLLDQPHAKTIRKWLPHAMLFLLATATLVSGSRGSIVFFCILFVFYFFISMAYTKARNKISMFLTLMCMLFLLAVIPFLFSRALDATEARFASAAESENVSERVLTIVFGESGIYKNFPLLGNGIGVGNNFSATVSAEIGRFSLGETESARTILEGGILGLIFIVLKALVVFVGFLKAWVLVKRRGELLPLMLWITTAFALITWPIIGQLTINALGYLLLGLAIASLRLSLKRAS